MLKFFLTKYPNMLTKITFKKIIENLECTHRMPILLTDGENKILITAFVNE